MATTRKFGIVTSYDNLSAGIVVNSLDFNETVQVAEARTETGTISDLWAYSQQKTVSISGVMDGTTADIARAGSTLTLDGKTWLITDVSRTESNTAAVSVQISARTADNAEITVLNNGTV